MKIAVIGTGNVGLVSAACFASKCHEVVCVDLDAARVEAINRGVAPFFEPGLEALLRAHLGPKLRASLDLEAAVEAADVTLLAVGTPFDGEQLDLRQIETAARQVGEALQRRDSYQLVMVKSTVLPGTTDDVVRPLLEAASGKRAGVDFGLAMNPEFLREGQAVNDFLHPDRVVMGGLDERCWQIQEELYRDFEAPDVLRTDNSTAEMIKYTSNSLLATLISFSNEIANLCATLPGVDSTEVMRGVHLDKRLSPIDAQTGERLQPGILAYLMAGCGFGGSCLPKDVQSLIAFGDQRGRPMPILRSVIETNAAQPGRVVEIARRHLERRQRSLRGAVVAVLGLAFKPGTSDIRETPALPVIEQLRGEGATLQLWDPAALGEVEARLGTAHDLVYATELDRALEGAEILVLLTSWPELRELPAKLERLEHPPKLERLEHPPKLEQLEHPPKLEQLDEPPLVIDGRRFLDGGAIERYDGIGLGPRADSRDRDPGLE